MNYYHLEKPEDIKLNFDWGWGRYEFYKRSDFGNGYIFCSWVGVPLIGIPARHFTPDPKDSSEKQINAWVKALLTEIGCRT